MSALGKIVFALLCRATSTTVRCFALSWSWALHIPQLGGPALSPSAALGLLAVVGILRTAHIGAADWQAQDREESALPRLVVQTLASLMLSGWGYGVAVFAAWLGGGS